RPRRVGKEVLLLVATAVPSMLVTAPHLLGAISVRAGYPTASWGAPGTFNTAVGSLLTFQHTGSTFQPLEKWPSIWLVVPLWIGLLRYRRLGYLRWVAGSALLIGGVYVLAVCYPQHWVVVLTSPWWNDSYRLITLAAVPATLIAGHGLAELQRGGAAMLHKLMGARGSAVPVALAAVVLVAFSLLSNGFYHAKNSAVTAFGYGNAPGQDKHKLTVSVDEARAMQWLGHVVRPGQRVMNDRYDGSAWMYAIAGVHPVAAHFDASKLAGTGPALLGADFNRYQSDPMVRADVRKLNVRWVMVDTGYVHPKHGYTRQAGLLGLAHDDWLRQVYRNADVTIYQLIPPPGQRYQPQAGSTKELGG
ncbi:MAG: DUF6541 family protein, partial [Sciscionella sp.]